MMMNFNVALPNINSLFASNSPTAFQAQWQQLQNQGISKVQLQQEAQTLQAQLGFVPPQLQQLINQFDAADTNKDGRLSQQELGRQAQKNFLTQPTNTPYNNPFFATSNNRSFQLGQQGLTGIGTLQSSSTSATSRYSASSDRLTNLISQFGTTGTTTDDEGVTSSSLLY
jgi:EF hand